MKSEDLYDPLPIVDAHHHIWELDGPMPPLWLFNTKHAYQGDNSAIRRTYLPGEYRRDCALHNVIGTVFIEAEVDRRLRVQETEWVTAQAAEHGFPNAIVAHAWIDEPDSEEVIARQASFPLVRGIRSKPIIASGPDDSVKGQRHSLQDPKWRAGLDLLRKHGLSWDLRVPWYHLEEAAEVVAEHPELRVALNHTGYPMDRSPEALAIWRRGMAALAAHPNVWCKISGLPVLGQPYTVATNGPIIREAIAIFGVERCMFASNYPVDGLKGSWDHLYRTYKASVADFSQSDREALFAGNAIRFYRIED